MQTPCCKSKQKVLALNSVSAGYNSTVVLRDVSLNIYHKDFIGVIGANGSGKTTLLKVIIGLIQPAKGNLRFFNDLDRSSIGYMPQAAVFDRKFPIRVADVVTSGLIAKVGMFKQFSNDDKLKTDAMLERMSISHLKNKAVGELSGGQMQRVFLARALISSPKLLVLDEPNTFVDKNFEK
ncbi:MAG: ATP-binding cassette domain-containing protein, partial [bacterium]|nr:ATP-binding cassette domain-containing protein [bacterium]